VQDQDDVSAIWDKKLSATEIEEIAEASRSGHVDSIGRAATETTEVQATRRVWDNPVLWREICTWAYGRKILIIRIAYISMSLLALFSLNKNLADIEAGTTLVGLETIIPPVASSIAPLFLVS
jgi:hypothetical protein